MNSRRIILFFEKVQCYCIVFVIIPNIFLLEMILVRPIVAEVYQVGTLYHIYHVFITLFLFVNIIGNMIMTILRNTKLRESQENGVYCEHCKMKRPEGSWHCVMCNACILRRDHHCSILSRCIGLHNYRYFIVFLFYVAVSMMYSVYFNYYFVATKFEDFGMIVSFLRIMNPFRFMAVPFNESDEWYKTHRLPPMGIKDMYLFFLLVNVSLMIWSCFNFVLHMRNVLRGVTVYESRHRSDLDYSKWKDNFIEVFGAKWYLAVVWPFAYSPVLNKSSIKP